MGLVPGLAQRVEDAGMQHGQLRLRVHHQPGLGDLGQADLAVLADLEFIGHGGHQALAQQLALAHAPAHGHGRVHEADVDGAGLQGLGLLGIAHLAQDDPHAGRLLPQRAQGAGQGAEQRRGHQAHGQLARTAPGDLARAAGGGIYAGHAGAHIVQHGQGGRGGQGALA